MAANETGQVIPRLALVLDQPFERLCDLPFLIALRPGRQRASFFDKLQPRLDQLAEFERME